MQHLTGTSTELTLGALSPAGAELGALPCVCACSVAEESSGMGAADAVTRGLAAKAGASATIVVGLAANAGASAIPTVGAGASAISAVGACTNSSVKYTVRVTTTAA